MTTDNTPTDPTTHDRLRAALERLVDEAQAMRGNHGHRRTCDRDHSAVPNPSGTYHSCRTLTDAIHDARAALAQPPAPAAIERDPKRHELTLEPDLCSHRNHPGWDCWAWDVNQPAPAATAETLRDAAQGQVVAWSARAASLRMLRSERAIGEAIGLAQAAAELDAIVLTVPDAARAEPLDVDALARFVVREHPTGAGDWACAECMVARDLHSDLIRDGYRCTPHAAAAYQTALAARTEGR